MTTLSDFLDTAKKGDTYWIEDAKIAFAVEIERQMVRCRINKRQLAARLGTSPAYITKVLRGDANLTIESLVKLARAVEGSLHIHVAHRADDVRWFDIVTAQPSAATSADAEIWARRKKASHGSVPFAA